MFNFKKIILIFLLVAFLVLLLVSFSLAEEEKGKPLEIEYPEIGGWRPERVEQAILPQYIKYIFTFAVAIAGLVAFGALIYGGFRYITSAGAPTAQTEAKDQIFAGIIGLVILLSSYLILTTINPQLVLLKPPELLTITVTSSPGVYVSTEPTFPDSGENVYPLPSFVVQDLQEAIGIKEEIKSLKIVNQPTIEKEGEPLLEELDSYYGVILYDKKNLEGNCEYFGSVDLPDKPYNENELKIKPASTLYFREIKPEEEKAKVTLCPEPNFKGDCTEEWPIGEWVDLEGALLPDTGFGIRQNAGVSSIKTDGHYLVLLRGGIHYSAANKKQCATYMSLKSISDLKGEPIHMCDPRCVPFYCWYVSCAKEIAIFPL